MAPPAAPRRTSTPTEFAVPEPTTPHPTDPDAPQVAHAQLDPVVREETREAVEEPARLIRIASTVQTLLEEVQTTELDEAARQRLTEIHNRTVEDLRSVVSGDLAAELEGLSLEPDDGTPTGAELRVMQAQLSGWLQGLFHGIQASIVTQQLAAQQQLARMRAQQPQMPAADDRGQYL